MRLDMMRGRMIIFSILIRTSPGNDISMIVSSLRLWGRRTNPISVPANTPLTVRTRSRLFLIHFSKPIVTHTTCTVTHPQHAINVVCVPTYYAAVLLEPRSPSHIQNLWLLKLKISTPVRPTLSAGNVHTNCGFLRIFQRTLNLPLSPKQTAQLAQLL